MDRADLQDRERTVDRAEPAAPAPGAVTVEVMGTPRIAPSRVLPATDPRVLLAYGVTIFTSAFLLFQVQPIIARSILPWFGSSPGVWATCMLFFQVLLLGGYAYAHVLVTYVPPKRQLAVHVGLLALALLTLPILPDASWKPTDADAPVLRILGILTASVGLPYLLLSASGPLLQGWFAAAQPGRSPYRLYALSNVGSLLALLSYPFLFEPVLGVAEQATTWSVAYVGLAILLSLCAVLFVRRAAPQVARTTTERVRTPAPARSRMLLWLVLSACGSALLLATTNQMCADVAVVPFLWVVPLAIYLLTFILTFDSERWYVRPVFLALLPFVCAHAVRLVDGGPRLDLIEQIGGYSVALFVMCMCLHGELARQRPAADHLTLFFLTISFGGAIGGLFVAVGAPALFAGMYEYPLLICLCAALMAGLLLFGRRDADASASRLAAVSGVVGMLAIAVLAGLALHGSSWGQSSSAQALFADWRGDALQVLAGASAVLLVLAEILRRRKGVSAATWYLPGRHWVALGSRALLVLGCVLLALTCVLVIREDDRRHVGRDRNFYGMLAMREYDAGTSTHAWGLKHGRIKHGLQLLEEPTWPTAYYGPRSGIGVALRWHPARKDETRPFRVGVIGLGVGTTAAYANAKIRYSRSDRNYVREDRHEHPDVMHFYELNPMVLEWAETKFSFLEDARTRGAEVETFLGDARIVLERKLAEEGGLAYDVLAVDAFSSDAIPIHLLTREAIEVYWKHLKPDGILALHVSNRFIDVKPVVRRLADEFGYEVLYTKNREDEDRGISRSSWMLMTNNRAFLDRRRVRRYERDLPAPGPLWTDDYSSLFELLQD